MSATPLTDPHRWLEVAVLKMPVRHSFTYAPPTGLRAADCPPGTLLRVPMGRRQMTAVVLHTHAEAVLEESRIRSATAALAARPVLDEAQLELARFVIAYYYLAPGQVLSWLLSPKLRNPPKSGPVPTKLPAELLPEPAPAVVPTGSVLTGAELPELSAEQQAVVQAMLSLEGFQPILLEGVAGSGKTEVYLRLMQQVLAEGRQVLYLVPEINLTPQAEEHIARRFTAPVACLHSQVAPARRSRIWADVASGRIRILVGTRSAIFTPFADLGLIVMDEEHDRSFRQDQGAPYNARDIALWRAQKRDILVVLGSATPSLETLRRAQNGEYRHMQMRLRIGRHRPPRMELVDRRGTPPEELFSAQTVAAIDEQLQAGRQALLFLNQRGYARMLLCSDCGWRVCCHRCDATKTLHLKRSYMLCHHCGAKSTVPISCGECGKSLSPTGAGTEKLMQWCKKTFADVPILQIDSDTVRTGKAMQQLMQRARDETPLLLVGTQMLAKGHHLPHLELVAVSDVSIGLLYPDFRSAELMIQTLIQVSGRAGRETGLGRVLMETTLPSHPMLQQLEAGDYGTVAASLMARRRSGQMPPFSHIAVISAESGRQGQALTLLQELRNGADETRAVRISGPLPRAMERLNNRWRAVLQLKAEDRKALRRVLSQMEPEVKRLTAERPWIQCSLVVDPLETI